VVRPLANGSNNVAEHIPSVEDLSPAATVGPGRKNMLAEKTCDP
jgi:hypothetical protein